MIAPITNTFFTTLISRLGIRPPFAEGFLMSNVVQPVSLVDSDILLPAVVTAPNFATPSTAGEQVAPAINTVLADSGQLAAGTYSLQLWLNVFETANYIVAFQHRDAANAANIWSQNFYGVAALQPYFVKFDLTKTVQLNERFRVQLLSVGGGTSRYHANIFSLQIQ